MHLKSGLILSVALFAALACGGGSSTTSGPAGAAPAGWTTPSQSLPTEWTSLGVSDEGGKVITSTSTSAAISYDSGTCKDRADKFAAPLEADGWTQTYATDDAESALVMVNKGDAKIVVSASKDGNGVLLAVSITGTPPASSHSAAPAAAPGAGSASGDAPAPAAKPAKPKRDCHQLYNDCNFKCEQANNDCTRECESVTDACSTACSDTKSSCWQACVHKESACDAE